MEDRMSNRLINETSPYLLQHAENPVDWYPWCEEAFERAKREDKPIFLSIGYSTCHWCHVMAHESFEDRRTAAILNRHFISIKVDREERPDIDSVYMTVCQVRHAGFFWFAKLFYNNPPVHIVVALKERVELGNIREQLPFLANVIVVSESGEYPLINDRTTFYVCKEHVCLEPANTLSL